MKKYKAWAVIRTRDDTIFDDGIEYSNKLAIVYPIFSKKADANLYIKKTFLQFKLGRGVAKVIPCEISYELK